MAIECTGVIQLTTQQQKHGPRDIMHYDDRSGLLIARGDIRDCGFRDEALPTVGDVLVRVYFFDQKVDDPLKVRDWSDGIPSVPGQQPVDQDVPYSLPYRWLKQFKEGDRIVTRPTTDHPVRMTLTLVGSNGKPFEEQLAHIVANVDCTKNPRPTNAEYLGYMSLVTNEAAHQTGLLALTALERDAAEAQEKRVEFFDLPQSWRILPGDIVVPVFFGFDDPEADEDDEPLAWGDPDASCDDYLPDYYEYREDVDLHFPTYIPLRVIENLKEGDILEVGKDENRTAFYARNLRTKHHSAHGPFEQVLAKLLEWRSVGR